MSDDLLPDSFRLLLGRQLPLKEPLQHGTSKDAEIIRQMIRHEDDVIDQRVTWLCQIQGFLFAALALAWKEPTANQLALILCPLGFIVSVTSWFGLESARKAVEKLVLWWDQNKAVNYAGPDVFGRRVDPSWRDYLRPWCILPILFCIAWFIVFIIQIIGPLKIFDSSRSIVIITVFGGN